MGLGFGFLARGQGRIGGLGFKATGIENQEAWKLKKSPPQTGLGFRVWGLGIELLSF